MLDDVSIAIVEDNDNLRAALCMVLSDHGCRVSAFSCAEELSEWAHAEALDLLLLDLNLPGEDGLSVAERLKRVLPRLGVIMMSTRTAVRDRVRGYGVGADLYLPKPISEDELLAAIQSLVRRIRTERLAAAGEAEAILKLDLRSRQLSGPHGFERLNSNQANLIHALALSAGRRMEHWQLIEIMGLELTDSNKAQLAVQISRIRIKIETVGFTRQALKAVHNQGYQLAVPIEII